VAKIAEISDRDVDPGSSSFRYSVFFQKIPVIWFVANVGGILGLTMGCSLVTIL
jgi:hypothetical protein